MSDSIWLRSAPPVHRIRSILPEHLISNLYMGRTLADIIKREVSACLMLESMYAQLGLDRTHAMCLPCLQKFVQEHLFAWCRRQLVAREFAW
jgi:hypothetical protein